ncbi:MAG TPA: Hsp20/alpha crystallin family protein [Lacipirellulaceae bacterium]
MASNLPTRRSGGLSSMWRRDPFTALREEMNDLRSRLWGGEEEGWFGAALAAPSVDLSETDTAVEVRMDLPGVKPDDIDIQVSGNILSVTGQRQEEKEEKGRTFHRVERHSGSFSRAITLPAAVNESEVAAEYRDGVLAITLPKSEQAKTRKIKVKS